MGTKTTSSGGLKSKIVISPPALTLGLCSCSKLESAFQTRVWKTRARQSQQFVKVLFQAFNLSPFNLNFMFPPSTFPIFEVMALSSGSRKTTEFAKEGNYTDINLFLTYWY